jgi:hypothetical protein
MVCERVIAPGGNPSLANTFDLVMLALTDGGKERTEQEFRDLFGPASLRLTRVVPTMVDHRILEVTK